MVDCKKSYYAIIPADVRYDETLCPNAKLLYGEITALCNDKGFCWASNDYFAKLYNVNKTTISRWIAQLKKNGYIFVRLEYREGTNEIINRYMQIKQDPIDEKINTPIDENAKDNNTLINNTINTTNELKQTIPPSHSDVSEYIRQHSFPITADEFIDCYAARGWMVGNHKMKDWQAAVRTYVRNAAKWGKNKLQNTPVKPSIQDRLKANEELFNEIS